jgi:hypothetical protein
MEKSVDHLIRTVHYRAERVHQAPSLAPIDLAEEDSIDQEKNASDLANIP